MQSKEPFVKDVTKPQMLNISILLCFIIISILAIFTCKSKDENKEAGNTEKTLNLALLFGDSRGIGDGYKWTIKDKIETLQYSYAINIWNDSIRIVAKQGMTRRIEDEEYRGKLTDDQYLKIKKIVSTLNPKYEYDTGRGRPGTHCILEVDNQILYRYKYCSLYHQFSDPGQKWPPMPEEIELLFKYVVGLSPIPITLTGEPNIYPKKYCLDSLCILRYD